MPALTKMESSFSLPLLEGRALSRPIINLGRHGGRPSTLMHARRYAVAAVSLDRRRATGESAEEGEGYDKRK